MSIQIIEDTISEKMPRALFRKRQAVKNALNSVLIEMVNYIKINGPWTDITSNLRNSISYVPAFDGTPDQVVEFTSMKNGRIGGQSYSSIQTDLASDVSDDKDSGPITGVIYAGMEYAVYIEYREGYWVISGAFSEYRGKILDMIAEKVREQ